MSAEDGQTDSKTVGAKDGQMTSKTVGANIQRIRLERGLTQEKLAEAIGISPTYMSTIETGRRYPSLKILVDIKNFFGVSIGQIMGDELNYGREELKDLDFYDRRLLRIMKLYSMAEKELICDTLDYLKDKK
ncbi:helix-turn-helix domain-containing protein [Diplocloster agilis]|nr:helix-turn-helix transcriptional regulator [Suonthocola fibrivorans]MCU6734881.1 helix-turn-helix domain-containing protein [Suonthocola fibrivorans]SCJ58034.1 anaerobic benzoate catabolism transcriptional regulator [uncultured Clostridium sp.]